MEELLPCLTHGCRGPMLSSTALPGALTGSWVGSGGRAWFQELIGLEACSSAPRQLPVPSSCRQYFTARNRYLFWLYCFTRRKKSIAYKTHWIFTSQVIHSFIYITASECNCYLSTVALEKGRGDRGNLTISEKPLTRVDASYL